jgi:hypothetical protein
MFTTEILDVIAEVFPHGLPYGKTLVMNHLWTAYGFFKAKYGTDSSHDWLILLEKVSRTSP